MSGSGEPVLLGEVETPTGVLLVIDPGLGRFWRGDGDPRSPRASDPEQVDLRIVGADAIAAGKAFDRQYDPRFLFDVADVPAMQHQFYEFVSGKHLKAYLEPLPERMSHTERAFKALEVGNGMGVVHYNGLWAVAIGGLPVNRSFRVHGLPLLDDEFGGRWRCIHVVIEPDAKVARSESVSGVMVEHGQLLCADVKAFGAFRMWESLDGLADFVFWGPDAPGLANEVSAARIDDKLHGWSDLPVDQTAEHAALVQKMIEERGLRIGVDYRPHCNLERLNAQVRSSEHRAGNLALSGSKVCGFDNRWGDGIFPVVRDVDGDGRLIRVRLDVGNEDRQSLARRVMLREMLAIVTRKVTDGGEPVRFAERDEPRRVGDSGWLLSSGTETEDYMQDADHFVLLRVGDALERWPALKAIIDTPPCAAFRMQGEAFIREG
jgi:hypothetical protein